MSENWMVVYKDGFASKLKRFLRKIFKMEKRYLTIHTENYKNDENKNSNEIIETNNAKDVFLNDIKVDSKDVDIVSARAQFLKEIEGNEKALYSLPIEKLQVLNKYYDSIIEENDKKIKRLMAE